LAKGANKDQPEDSSHQADDNAHKYDPHWDDFALETEMFPNPIDSWGVGTGEKSAIFPLEASPFLQLLRREKSANLDVQVRNKFEIGIDFIRWEEKCSKSRHSGPLIAFPQLSLPVGLTVESRLAVRRSSRSQLLSSAAHDDSFVNFWN
jgi:hypothetical protein